MLSEIMTKYGLSDEDIEGEKLNEYYFNIEKSDNKFWCQVVRHVNRTIQIYGTFPKKMVKDYDLAGNSMIRCTPCEFIEIKTKFEFYIQLYNEELNIFYRAFLTANGLLVNDPDTYDKEVTEKEYEEWMRVNSMASKIKVGEFMKQINL
jgi:hypothetical protein